MFQTKIEIVGNTAEVKMIGDLDTNASEQFIADVEKCLKQDVREVNFNMEQLAFISSSGLRKLLAISKMVAAEGGALTVSNVSADIMQIFALTGFDGLLGLK